MNKQTNKQTKHSANAMRHNKPKSKSTEANKLIEQTTKTNKTNQTQNEREREREREKERERER